jgi:hypothetical protein
VQKNPVSTESQLVLPKHQQGEHGRDLSAAHRRGQGEYRDAQVCYLC